MKSCSTCGALNLDSENACGVCGEVLNGSAKGTNEIFNMPTRRRVHVRGLFGLAISIVVTVSGIVLLVTAWDLAPIGLYMFLFGILATGSIVGMFRGLPYQPNFGWHRGGDPDIAATNSKGALPSNYAMMEVDRELEAKRKAEESD